MRRNFLDVFPCGAIDDACLEFADGLDDTREFVGLSLRVRDAEREIVPRETAHENLRRLAPEFSETELLDNVVAHFGRGGGGECNDLRLAEFLERPFQSDVIGTKIMSPLRNA